MRSLRLLLASMLLPPGYRTVSTSEIVVERAAGGYVREGSLSYCAKHDWKWANFDCPTCDLCRTDALKDAASALAAEGTT